MKRGMAAQGIDYFNRGHPLTAIQSRISLRMRKKMLDSIPVDISMRILEVGVTPDTQLIDSNFFSHCLKDRGCEVSVTSPEDCSSMAKTSGIRWLPFENFEKEPPAYDLVLSCAVIEHAGGSVEAKKQHLRLLRAASRQMVFIATPHRFHWMEFHTKLPLIHWLPKHIHRRWLSALGFPQWASPNHLDLLDRQEFESLVSAVFPDCQIQYRHWRFLGAISNLTALIHLPTA